jgi:SNF2 family DNA or RNA helicase
MDRYHYEKMKADFKLEFATKEILAVNAAVVTGKLQQLASGFIYDTTRTPNPDSPGKWIVTQTPIWLSDRKLDLLDEILEENQHANTLIAYTYQEELAALQRKYPQLETLDNPNVIDRWNEGKVRLLAVHPKSAGHGLNLQFGGCHIVFFSLPWSLELYEQTIGRLHRSGQTKDVWCYVLLTNNTVDEKIWAALHDKRAVSDIAIGELQ